MRDSVKRLVKPLIPESLLAIRRRRYEEKSGLNIRGLEMDLWDDRSLVDMVRRGLSYAHQWQDLKGEANILPANPLRDLFETHEGHGVWKWHQYLTAYHEHFAKFIGREVRVLEIGIYAGGSLEMWHSYFGPQCTVYGIDIEPGSKRHENEQTKIFIGDQSDREFLRSLKAAIPPVDIIIDDGGHRIHQQTATLEELLPHTRPGAVYVCEDLHGEQNAFLAFVFGVASRLSDYQSAPDNSYDLVSDVNAFQKDIASVHLYPFLAIIERNESPPTCFTATRRGAVWPS